MQYLVYDDVLAAARKAYVERRLQFQLIQDFKIPIRTDCDYRIDRHPKTGCVVGVSLSDETVVAINKKLKDRDFQTDVLTVINAKIIDCDKPDELATLQTQHDTICSHLRYLDINPDKSLVDKSLVSKEEKIFCELIGLES